MGKTLDGNILKYQSQGQRQPGIFFHIKNNYMSFLRFILVAFLAILLFLIKIFSYIFVLPYILYMFLFDEIKENSHKTLRSIADFIER
jgi:hypothetical protein